MAQYNPVGGQQYYLGASISSTATTILLSSFLEPVTGTPLTMANMATDIAYGTLAPKTTSSEFISFTGVTQNAGGTATLTGVTRGLAKKSPFTSDSAYKLPHSGQSVFILSDAPQVFQEYVPLNNNVTVGGIKTFTSSPVVPTGGTGQQAANATDIANAISGASGTATDTVFGTVKLSVAAAAPLNPIVAGTNDPRIPTQNENDALVGYPVSPAPSSTMKYLTQNTLTSGSVYVASTVSFTSGSKTISDSASGFVAAGFMAGESITVAGSASNNGTFTIVSVAAGAIVVLESLVTEAAGASVTLTSVSASKVLVLSPTGAVPPGISIGLASPFGDGSDGNVVISSPTTLTRDMFYNNLTINNGISLNTANYRIFVKDTLTNNNATTGIINNGGDASTSGGTTTAGAAVAAGSLAGGATGGLGIANGTRAGGSGGAGGGVIWIAAYKIAVEGGIQAKGGNGSAPSSGSGTLTNANGNPGGSITKSFITTSGGGKGGDSTSATAGIGGTNSTTKESSKNISVLQAMYDFVLSLPLAGGAGGGGGCISDTSGPSPTQGGGGQGGTIVEIYHSITTTGTVSVAGGTAGSGSGTGAASGGNGINIRVQI